MRVVAHQRCVRCGINLAKDPWGDLCRGCLDEGFPGGAPELRSIPRTEPNENRAATTSEHGLGALSRADSLAEIDRYPPQWRVPGVISTDDYGIVAGRKGVGKTFAFVDLGVAVSLGERWFGRFETVRAPVLLLSSEESRARLWRRADAVARSMGRDVGELDGWLFVHPFSFSAVADLPRLRAELSETGAGLVLLDPAYRYMHGVRAQLFDMGAVLTPLQETCAGEGAPLLVGHHYNRQEGRAREERISGAGLLEWARLVMTIEAQPRRDTEAVVATLEITGNSIDPVTLALRRAVVALDETSNPELSYSVEVLAEGTEAIAARYQTVADRVYAALPEPPDSVTVRQIGDLVAADATGKGGLKADTIRKALNRDLKDRADGADGAWWRT